MCETAGCVVNSSLLRRSLDESPKAKTSFSGGSFLPHRATKSSYIGRYSWKTGIMLRRDYSGRRFDRFNLADHPNIMPPLGSSASSSKLSGSALRLGRCTMQRAWKFKRYPNLLLLIMQAYVFRILESDEATWLQRIMVEVMSSLLTRIL